MLTFVVLAGVGAALFGTLSGGQSRPSDPADACPSSATPAKAPPPFDPRGARYAGSGPHPMVLMRDVEPGLLADRAVDLVGDTASDVPHIPGAWLPPGNFGDNYHDPASYSNGARYKAATQLVVCEYLESVGKRDGSCPYVPQKSMTDASPPDDPSDVGGDVPVVRARYRYNVYQARTAELVTAFELPGFYAKSNPLGPCPQEIPGGVPTDGQIPEPVSDTALQAKLRPLVEGTR